MNIIDDYSPFDDINAHQFGVDFRTFFEPTDNRCGYQSDAEKLEAWHRYKEQLQAMPYPEFLQSDYWHDVRSLVKRRDSFECVDCGSRHQLQVHHNNYEHRGNEIKMLHTLETLCSRCHARRHCKPVNHTSDSIQS